MGYECPTFVDRSSALLGFIAQIELDHHLRARRTTCNLVEQFDTVDALPDRHNRCQTSHLVSLQTSEKMPFDALTLIG